MVLNRRDPLLGRGNALWVTKTNILLFHWSPDSIFQCLWVADYQRLRTADLEEDKLCICLMLVYRSHFKHTAYRFPSLFAVDMFRHFGPRILDSQINSPFLTRKLTFWTNFTHTAYSQTRL